MSTVLRDCNDTKGLIALKEMGFQDNVLNAMKLTIYNGNVDLACKYYHYDEWCHQYCIFSSCKNNNNCKGNHRYSLTYLIKNENFCKGKLLCEYLLYFYTNYCAKQNKTKKRAWIAQLHWKLAQIYCKDKCSKFNEYALAQAHFQHAVENHWHKSQVLVDYAIFLQNKMHNPTDGEICLIEALKWDNNSVTNLQMGKFLLRQNRYKDAIEYFWKVLRLNEFEPEYTCHAYYGFGFSLYNISDINGAQEMYDEAFRIDKKINHGELKFAPKGAIEIYTQIKYKTKLIGSKISSISENVYQSVCRCDNVIEKKEESQNEIEIRLKNDECNPLAYEFEMFWKDLPYFETTKSKYFSKFVSKEYNSIGMITLITNDILMNDIGMNSIHSKLFEQFALEFENRKKEFLQWLKSFKFPNDHEYELMFLKLGIYSFESFYRRIKNVQSLINKLKNTSNTNTNNYDEIIDYDCYQMWQNTPKYKRQHGQLHLRQTQTQ